MNKFLQKLRDFFAELREFFSLPEKLDYYNIIVNGKECQFYFDSIYYDELVYIAFQSDEIIYTITYRHKDTNIQGCLSLDEFVNLKDGMVFNVIDTSKA